MTLDRRLLLGCVRLPRTSSNFFGFCRAFVYYAGISMTMSGTGIKVEPPSHNNQKGEYDCRYPVDREERPHTKAPGVDSFCAWFVWCGEGFYTGCGIFLILSFSRSPV
jgi:hypothetical protein